MDIKPEDIISGKIKYTIDDFIKDFNTFISTLNNNKSYTEEEKRNYFKHIFMFVLLLSCDKPVQLVAKVLQIPEDKAIEGQTLFKREIDVLRAIWMATYLEIMKSHMVSDGIVLKLLNTEIQTILRSLFPDEYHHDGTT